MRYINQIKASCCIAALLSLTLTAPSSAQEVSEKQPEISKGSGSFLAGRHARSVGDLDRARSSLEEALQADSTNETLRGQLMVLALSRGDIKQAAIHANRLQVIEGHEPIVDLILAVDSIKHGESHLAQNALDAVFANTENTLWKPLFDAWIKLGGGALEKPIRRSDILEKGQAAPTFLTYHLALINDVAAHTDIAETQYKKALNDEGNASFRAVEAAADFYRREGMKQELDQLKQDYAADNPSLQKLTLSTDPDLDYARMVGTPEQGFAELLFTMASVLYTVDAAEDTQLYLHMALYLRDDFPLAKLLLANVQEDNGQYKDAIAMYSSIDRNSPLYKQALLRRAYILEKQGDLDEALNLLEQDARNAENDYESLVAKADLMRNHANYEGAVENYSRAFKRISRVKQQHWAIYFSRGASYERIGKWDKAREDLKQALSLNPDHPEILNYLGYGMLTRDEDVAEAERMIERAYALQPGAAHIIDSLGWAKFKNGRYEEAVKHLEQAIEQMPGDATVNDHLGDAYWRVGRRTEARYQWERALLFVKDEKHSAQINDKLANGLPPVDSALIVPETAMDTNGAGAPATN